MFEAVNVHVQVVYQHQFVNWLLFVGILEITVSILSYTAFFDGATVVTPSQLLQYAVLLMFDAVSVPVQVV